MGGVTKASQLLGLIKELLPELNELPKPLYEMKNIMHNLGVNYENLYACPKDNAPNTASQCGIEVQFLPKGLWYIPHIQRFKQLFRKVYHAIKLNLACKWKEK